MVNYYSIFEIDSFFWFFALLGTALFFIRFLFILTGMGVDDELTDDHADADFKILSMHSITGFFMFFGWSGLTSLHQFNLPLGLASFVAFGCGLCAIFILRMMFTGARKLISKGYVFNIKDAEGRIGSVYQRIPANGSGKIILSMNAVNHELEALSEDFQEIPSFVKVKVIKALAENKVLVSKLHNEV